VPACKRARLTGTIRVPLPPQLAFTLFTPTGERAWAPGWDPRFPSPVIDDTEPGTVFQTEHNGRHTTWTVIRRETGKEIAYVTVTAEGRAGLVTVTCEPATDETTTATVGYDLTALTPEANADLDEFAANYPQLLDHWQHSIAQAVAGRQITSDQRPDRDRPH
jgi:hypothetical protein